LTVLVASHCSVYNLESMNVSNCGNITIFLGNETTVEWSGDKSKLVAKFLKYALNYTFEGISAEISYYLVPDLHLIFNPNLTKAYIFDYVVSITDLRKLYNIIQEC